MVQGILGVIKGTPGMTPRRFGTIKDTLGTIKGALGMTPRQPGAIQGTRGTIQGTRGTIQGTRLVVSQHFWRAKPIISRFLNHFTYF